MTVVDTAAPERMIDGITLESAWERANQVCGGFEVETDATRIFYKLMDQYKVYQCTPDEMARLIVRNASLAEYATVYFRRTNLNEIEIRYYLLLVSRGDIK